MTGMRNLPGHGMSVHSQDNASPLMDPTEQITGKTKPPSLCSHTCLGTLALAFTAALGCRWTPDLAIPWELRSHLATQIPASSEETGRSNTLYNRFCNCSIAPSSFSILVPRPKPELEV